MSASRRRLGRGLEALLGSTSVEQARRDGTLAQLAVAAISPNPFQPRREFDDDAMADLAGSMRTAGLLQPIVVRPAAGHRYELIAGERRWRAAQRLEWTEIGAIVKEVDDRTLLALALVENLQRDALSPIEEAHGYARLIEEFAVSQKQVGELVGRDRSTVANQLRLLRLPITVQAMVHGGQLSTGHARALVGMSDERSIGDLARQAVAEGLSVREVEDRSRGHGVRRRGRRRAPRKPDAALRRVEDALRRRLQTDVRVTRRGKASGRVTINYYSQEDLERILEIVLGGPLEE